MTQIFKEVRNIESRLCREWGSHMQIKEHKEPTSRDGTKRHSFNIKNHSTAREYWGRGNANMIKGENMTFKTKFPLLK